MGIKSAVKTFYRNKVVEQSLLGQFIRKWRRFFLGIFCKKYIEKSITENRTGECHRCGLCCELLFKCPFLGKDNQNLPYCRVYGALRPTNCHNYPFDLIDSEIDKCGYKFKTVSPSQLSTVKSKQKQIYGNH